MESNAIQLVALAVVGAVGVVGLFLLFRWSPRWGVALWVMTMFFTPIWTKVTIAGLGITAMIGVTIIAIAASYGGRIPWSHVDTIVLLLLVTLLFARFYGGSISGHFEDVMLMWLIPFLWGRRILAHVSLSWLAVCIAAAAAVAAVLALYEFVTGHNFFLDLPGASSSVWSDQRERAGLLRVEGAFGHSIALGGALSMAVPFILIARWPAWVRFAALAVTAVATTVTFSRLGLIGFAATVVLSLIFLAPRITAALRTTVWVTLGAALIAGIPLLLGFFTEAGTEAEGSAEYRVDLISLVNSMAVIGRSSAYRMLPTGVDYWGSFRSIDSAMILAGLQFGLVPLAIMLVLLVILVVGMLRRPTPASIAVVAQIPAFATVALITQYASFVWFLGGLAVTAYRFWSRHPTSRSDLTTAFDAVEIGRSRV